MGDSTTNIRDMIAKGRYRHRIVTAERQPRGERHGMAKLTEEEVRVIRRLRDAGVTLAPLAQTFGVSQTTIHCIAMRKKWAHVI